MLQAFFSIRLSGVAALVCGMLLACSVWAGERDLDVSANREQPTVLTEYVSVLSDESQALALSDVRQADVVARFLPSTVKGSALSFGYTKSAVWLRLQLRNTSDQPLQRYLEVAYAGLSTVQMHQVRADGSTVSYVTGGALAFSTRPLASRFFVFPLLVPAHSEQTVFLRVQSMKSMVVPVRLWEPLAYQAYERSDYMAQCWYFGMATAMVIFNLLLFIALRDRIYLLYVGFVSSLALTLSSGTGLAKEYLWPHANTWSEYAVAVGNNVAIALLLLFMRSMLNIRSVAPWLNRLMLWLAAAYLILPLGYAIAYQAFAEGMLVFQVMTALFIVAVGVYCAKKGQRSAVIFLLAFSALVIGGISSALLTLDRIPVNAFTLNGMQLGSAMEMLLLALALADRLNESRKATSIAQAEALSAERKLVESLRASERLLEERVQARTAELSSTVERLQRTQADLVQSEKLASLGSLVAGVAHELNTPIGNALTVATTLQDTTRELKSTMDKGEMRKSTLSRYMDDALPMADLIARSCERASLLVSSFKRVAVDQTTEHRRKFDVRALVEDVCNSLRPGFKNVSWQMDIQIPEGIECDSYPGPLGQVVANLVQNASIHAFTSHPDGTLRLSATATDNEVSLEIADNGAGMSPEVLAHIFDPFYTTRLGQGGSGLGLSICMNIVTGVLGGSLQALSESGKGSRFIIRFPRIAPEKAFVDAESEFSDVLLQRYFWIRRVGYSFPYVFCLMLQSSWAIRFAPCPPPFGLLLYLRKSHSPTALASAGAQVTLNSFLG
ncbi:MAG: sensor histidine kinase [Rhodoferax sp.]|nr:sensor histidine kinase [Rhodoferax sp.]